MKANRIALALQHGALEIVVEQNPRQAGPGLECADMAAQEVLHPCIERETQKDAARPGKNHDEGHQRPARAADVKVAEMGPVDLPLLAGKRAQTQVRFAARTRPVQRDQVAEVIRAATVATLAHHQVQPTGGEGWKFLQGIADEGQISVDL